MLVLVHPPKQRATTVKLCGNMLRRGVANVLRKTIAATPEDSTKNVEARRWTNHR